MSTTASDLILAVLARYGTADHPASREEGACELLAALEGIAEGLARRRETRPDKLRELACHLARGVRVVADCLAYHARATDDRFATVLSREFTRIASDLGGACEGDQVCPGRAQAAAAVFRAALQTQSLRCA